MSLFITQADSLCVSTASLGFTLLFWPSYFPPYLLPPSLLPPSSLGSCFLPVSTSLGREGCLIPASSTFPLSFLSLSSLSACVSFQQLALVVDSPLSHRNGLHYLPSSPSSKMTFSDFTKARQFNSVKLLQSGERK